MVQACESFRRRPRLSAIIIGALSAVSLLGLNSVHLRELCYPQDVLVLDALEQFIADDPPIVSAARVNAAHAALYGSQRVYPVSFSLPSSKWDRVATGESIAQILHGKRQLWSSIIPGNKETYTFWTEEAYMRQYSESWKAWTYRKSGVDCARHVEIIAAGGIPVFRSVRNVPAGTMIGYPLKLLRFIEDNHEGATPEVMRIWVRLLARWGLRHLTSSAMIRYMAEVAGVSSFLPPAIAGPPDMGTSLSALRTPPLPPLADCVLFVDESLPEKFNYLAAFTLIGLVEVFGPHRVHVLRPPHYLYDSSSERTANLYGGGFGFARTLPGAFLSAQPAPAAMREALATGRYGLVVYGSVYRQNGKTMLEEAVRAYASHPGHLWLCHGGDSAPSVKEFGPGGSLLPGLPSWHESVTLFVREMPFTSK
jgi:hypothetical protein